MEEFFIIKIGEDEYSSHLEYDDMAFEYCIDILEIPEEKIEYVTIVEESIELSLKNLINEDIGDDWYVNLYKISSK